MINIEIILNIFYNFLNYIEYIVIIFKYFSEYIVNLSLNFKPTLGFEKQLQQYEAFDSYLDYIYYETHMKLLSKKFTVADFLKHQEYLLKCQEYLSIIEPFDNYDGSNSFIEKYIKNPEYKKLLDNYLNLHKKLFIYEHRGILYSKHLEERNPMDAGKFILYLISFICIYILLKKIS